MKKIHSSCLAGYLGFLLTALCAPSFGVPINNLVQNGSFEGGWQNGPVDWGWTYNVGLESGFSGAADGGNWADVFGTIYQDLATTPGQVYHLRFALAGNFNITVPTVADVLWGGTGVGSVTWSSAGHGINNLGWVWGDFNVTALSSSTRLTISDPFVGDSSRILRVDAVSVQAVPDASASVSLLGLGLLGVFGVGRYLKVRKLESLE